MQNIQDIIACMEKSPRILADLIEQISPKRRLERRIPGKWSIHEHAVHLADVQPMLLDRFKTFRDVDKPVFEPFVPGKTEPHQNLLERDLEQSISDFRQLRAEMISLVSHFGEGFWAKTAKHPEYEKYSAQILLRHILMHDHFHMYRIEMLWLTADSHL